MFFTLNWNCSLDSWFLNHKMRKGFGFKKSLQLLLSWFQTYYFLYLNICFPDLIRAFPEWCLKLMYYHSTVICHLISYIVNFLMQWQLSLCCRGSGGVTNVKWQREMFHRHTTCPPTNTDMAMEGWNNISNIDQCLIACNIWIFQ